MKKALDKFIIKLQEAAKNMKDDHYFQLPVAGSSKRIFRERVYCYELYHQLRNILQDGFSYKLYGEVDKTGHPLIPGANKPDFIVHEPGNMDRNLVVIEVKSVTGAKLKSLEKDIDTIKRAINEWRYYGGILLIYGNGVWGVPDNIKKKKKKMIGGGKKFFFL